MKVDFYANKNCYLNNYKRKQYWLIVFSRCIAILSFAFLISCNSTQPLNNEKPEPLIPNTTDTFPIKIGNHWHFTSSGSVAEIDWKIVSDSLIDGNLYYCNQISYNKNISGTSLIRKDENGDIIERIGNEDFIWLKLSAPASSGYMFPFQGINNTQYNVSVRKGIKTILSDSSIVTCTVFDFDATSIMDEEIRYFYSVGYGIVGIYSHWYGANLTQAKMD